MDIDEILSVLVNQKHEFDELAKKLPDFDKMIENYKALGIENHNRAGYTKLADEKYITDEIERNRSRTLDKLKEVRDRVPNSISILTRLIDKIGSKNLDIRENLSGVFYTLHTSVNSTYEIWSLGQKCDVDSNRFLKRKSVSTLIDLFAATINKTRHQFDYGEDLVISLNNYVKENHGLKFDTKAIERALISEGLNVGHGRKWQYSRENPVNASGNRISVLVTDFGVVPAIKAKAIIKKVFTDFGLDKEYDLSDINQRRRAADVHPGYSIKMIK